jgi:hypothetical protein
MNETNRLYACPCWDAEVTPLAIRRAILALLQKEKKARMPNDYCIGSYVLRVRPGDEPVTVVLRATRTSQRGIVVHLCESFRSGPPWARTLYTKLNAPMVAFACRHYGGMDRGEVR